MFNSGQKLLKGSYKDDEAKYEVAADGNTWEKSHKLQVWN